MADDNGGTGNLLWFVAGAAIGVSAGMLLAPVSGADARRNVVAAAGQGKDAIAASGANIFERGRDMFERAQKLIDDASEMFERGRRLVEGTAAVFQKQSASAAPPSAPPSRGPVL